MTPAIITISICVIALGLMFRSVYLNDHRIKQGQKRQELQEELDRQNLGKSFDRDLEKWVKEQTDPDFETRYTRIPPPSYEDYIYAAASYECDPKDREEVPFSWPWPPSFWQPTARQGLRGRIMELRNAQKYYRLAVLDMERKGIEIPLFAACKQKIETLDADILTMLKKKESGCAAKSPGQ